jgi:hypothetical protein
MVLMDSPAAYFHWGFILISIPNRLVIAGMLALFTLALVVPYGIDQPGDQDQSDQPE